MTEDDEFRFLPRDAARVGRTAPLPEVTRVSIEAGEGRRVSALSFTSVQEAESAPEFVFLHGVGLNAHGWDPVVLALDAPALAVDLPGHGHSDWRADADYRPDLLAADVAPVLDALAPEPFELVGHSLGGLTAIVLAAMRPDRVGRLVVVDITPGVVPKQDAAAIVEFIQGKRAFDSQDEMVDRAIAFGIGTDRAALAQGVALNSRRRPDGRWEWMHHFAHLDGAPITEESDPAPLAALWAPLEGLHAAGVPVALVRATEGLVDDSLAEEWRRRLPGSQVRTVPGPHNLHEVVPAELAAAIRSVSPTRRPTAVAD